MIKVPHIKIYGIMQWNAIMKCNTFKKPWLFIYLFFFIYLYVSYILKGKIKNNQISMLRCYKNNQTWGNKDKEIISIKT